MIRSLVLLALLTGVAWWLHGEQTKGRLREVDEVFLDFLLANTRDQLQPDTASLDRVILITMRESDKAEFSTWPPAPIDYHMVLKSLVAPQPDVLTLTEPLAWPEPKPSFITQLGDSLLPFARVVLSARSGSTTDLAFAKERLPVLRNVRGDTTPLPPLTGITQAPEPELARHGDSGLLASSVGMRFDNGIAPSVELQTLAHATRTPFAFQRINLGPGAGLHLGDEYFIPLENNGSFIKPSVTVSEINALDLMTPNVEDEATTMLGKNKIIILGLGDDGTRQRAQIIAASLALPKLHVIPFIGQLIAWSIAALLALSLVWVPKTKALTRTLVFLVLALTASYLAFQAFKTWCPPAVPAALIITGGVFARLFGKRVISETSPATTEAPL